MRNPKAIRPRPGTMGSTTTDVPIIDTDSHIIEPADLWTSRLASRWGAERPHVRRMPKTGEDMWFIGDDPMSPAGQYAMVGWPGLYPDHPPTLEEAIPAGTDPIARLAALDGADIKAQVLYPNLMGG